MMAGNVKLEWRQGANGDGAIYVFNPKPSLTREEPAQKQAEFDIPLADGVQVQDLGRAKRTITLSGWLYAKDSKFETLEDKRRNLVQGITRLPGQLHIISLTNMLNSQHIFYRAQISPEGVQFKTQENPTLLEYEIQLLCADPEESYSAVRVTAIASSAKVV